MGPAWYSRLKQFNWWLRKQQTTPEDTYWEVTVGKTDIFQSWLAGISCSTEIVQFCIMSYNLYCVPLSIIGGLGGGIVERNPLSTGRNCSWCHHFCVFVFLFVYVYLYLCIVLYRCAASLIPRPNCSSRHHSDHLFPDHSLGFLLVNWENVEQSGSQFAETIQLCSL